MFAISAAAIVALTAFVESPTEPHDPFAAARVMILAHRGDDASYEVEYRFRRRRADGSVLQLPTTVARGPGVRVERRDDGSGSIDIGARSWSCTPATEPEETVECLEVVDDAPPIGAATPFAVAALSERYEIQEVRGRRVAGRDTRCFAVRLVATTPVAGLGSELDACFDESGIPLWTRNVGPLATDERTAVSVQPVDRARLRALVAEVSGGAVALDS